MAPNVDLNNNSNSNNNNNKNHEGNGIPSHQHQQQQNRRCFRPRQLKKILPGDHVTVEKNYPRFYEKCRNLKLLRDFQDRQEDQRVSHWAAVENSFNRRHSSHSFTNQAGQHPSTVKETQKSAEFKFGATGTITNKMAAAASTLEIKMADHLNEMSLHRGCWLQAKYHPGRKTENLAEKEAPRVVFLHRKRSPTEIRPRCQLAREVLAEFEREKRKLESKSSFFTWKLSYDHLCRRVS